MVNQWPQSGWYYRQPGTGPDHDYGSQGGTLVGPFNSREQMETARDRRTHEPAGTFDDLLNLAIREGATAYKPMSKDHYILYRHVQPGHLHAGKAILFHQPDWNQWRLSLWIANHIPTGVHPIEQLKGLGP